jgi:hypothetical protein
MEAKRFYSRVAGVTFDNADGSSRQALIRRYARPGQRLLLRPEVENPAEQNATGIYISTAEGTYQIGYITQEANSEVSRCLLDGIPVLAHILEVTGGTREKPTLGLNIEVVVGNSTQTPGQAKKDQSTLIIGCAVAIAVGCMLLALILLIAMMGQ